MATMNQPAQLVAGTTTVVPAQRRHGSYRQPCGCGRKTLALDWQPVEGEADGTAYLARIFCKSCDKDYPELPLEKPAGSVAAPKPNGRTVQTIEGPGVKVTYSDVQSGDKIMIPGTSGQFVVRSVEYLGGGRVRVHLHPQLTVAGAGCNHLVVLAGEKGA